ncbi:hypothetical protein KQX54_018126 [Cotesia glomerata]|uniref:BTB domain-containing protein n=1 Tax=Cotesia glomerata TaxID=32391 RepID=A0AAV7IJA5_COTGL|nr:hypothetical protein KQX54_018126 [Cotesia glomerata]
MSIEENQSTDRFQITNLENVNFHIGLKFPCAFSNIFTLWVEKSSLEPANAMIKVIVGNVEAQVEANNWKDLVYIQSNATISGAAKTRQLYDRSLRVDYYFCDINITCEIIWRSSIDSSLNYNPYDEIQRFYNSEELSDVTIIVNQVRIPAHKVVLAAHSEVFSKMLQSKMKEAKDGEINIKDLDPEVIFEVLHYCYKGTTKASYDFLTALQVLEVADIYQFIKLKKICEVTLGDKMFIGNALKIIDAADDYNAVDLRRKAIQFIVQHRKKLLASGEFKELFFRKHELVYEIVQALGDL